MGRAGGDIVGVFPRVAVPCVPLGCRHLRYDMKGVHLWAPQGGKPARPGQKAEVTFAQIALVSGVRLGKTRCPLSATRLVSRPPSRPCCPLSTFLRNQEEILPRVDLRITGDDVGRAWHTLHMHGFGSRSEFWFKSQCSHSNLWNLGKSQPFRTRFLFCTKGEWPPQKVLSALGRTQ